MYMGLKHDAFTSHSRASGNSLDGHKSVACSETYCILKQDAVTSVVAHPSPKGYLFISGSADKTLRTWDARTGSLVREHKGHQGPILGVALGLKGEVVISAGDDGVCLVFITAE
jgi:WD40 repeat protein